MSATTTTTRSLYGAERRAASFATGCDIPCCDGMWVYDGETLSVIETEEYSYLRHGRDGEPGRKVTRFPLRPEDLEAAAALLVKEAVAELARLHAVMVAAEAAYPPNSEYNMVLANALSDARFDWQQASYRMAD